MNHIDTIFLVIVGQLIEALNGSENETESLQVMAKRLVQMVSIKDIIIPNINRYKKQYCTHSTLCLEIQVVS